VFCVEMNNTAHISRKKQQTNFDRGGRCKALCEQGWLE